MIRSPNVEGECLGRVLKCLNFISLVFRAWLRYGKEIGYYYAFFRYGIFLGYPFGPQTPKRSIETIHTFLNLGHKMGK